MKTSYVEWRRRVSRYLAAHSNRTLQDVPGLDPRGYYDEGLPAAVAAEDIAAEIEANVTPEVYA